MNSLRLSGKFNLVFLTAFLVCIIFSGIALSSILNHNAEAQTVAKAQIMLQTMDSVRNYTSTQITPELEPKMEQDKIFLPQTVPGYSAREVFEHLRSKKEYAEFFYKEATINPTNLRDKADTFETELVKRFRSDANAHELTGFRPFASGDLFYIARPIAITVESCLHCHSTPEAAPKSMLAIYGKENGFGWKLNEIVGAQIISVPFIETVNSSRQILLFVMLAVCGMFAITILSLNLFLRQTVIKPINQMAQVAHDISIGKMDAEFQQTSHDEIGVLANAFNRMKLSLSMAMHMLNNPE